MPIYYGSSTYFSDRVPVALKLNVTNPNALTATYGESRNLFKVKLESLILENPLNPPNRLAESSVNIDFPNIQDGDEGIIQINNTEGDTQLNLDLFKQNKSVFGDLQVKQPGLTLLRFVYFDGVYHFSTIGDQFKSLTETSEIELNVSASGNDDTGGVYNDFATPNGALAWVVKNARFTANTQAFSTDIPQNSVTIKIHNDENNTPFQDTIHLPDMPSIGIHILGINNVSGNKPIIDASNQPSQFQRGLFSRNSRYVTIENIHLKNDAALVVVTRYSELALIDCTLECVDPTNPRIFLFCTDFSKLKIAGRTKVISASGKGDIFIKSSSSSEVDVTNIVSTSSGNRNAKLLIIVETPIKFNQILEATNFSSLRVSSYLDTTFDGTINYVPGSIYSDNPTMKFGFNSLIENNSVTFP